MSAEGLCESLLSLCDEGYKEFQCRLMPTVEPETVLGVRTPELRRLALKAAGTPEAEEFLVSLPHAYYEENNLHGFLIERIGGYEPCAAATDTFLPYIDNWATCDMTNPKALIKEPARLLLKVDAWMASGQTFAVRFGIETLMRHFLDARFEPGILRRVAAVRSEEYYVETMAAWFFATALAKRFSEALPYIQEGRLPDAVRSMAIRKATESRRLSNESKALLRSMR